MKVISIFVLITNIYNVSSFILTPLTPFGINMNSKTIFMGLKATPEVSATSQFSLKEYLLTLSPLIEERLSKCLEHQDTNKTKKITEAMYYSLLAGGKR